MPRDSRNRRPKRNGPPEAIPFQRRQSTSPVIQPAVTASLPAPVWVDTTFIENQLRHGTNAFRLAFSPLAWLESLGEDLVLSWKTEPARDAFLAEIKTRLLEPQSSYRPEAMPVPRRLFGRHLARAAQERLAPVLLQGFSQGHSSLPLETQVTEKGLVYGIDFTAGYSVGLFLDQRLNRAHLGSYLQTLVASGTKPRVLNTFAYTCSFSVVAAMAGAETLSLDLSRKSLQRGESNFAKNQLDLASGAHRFIADDVFAVLPRLAKRGEQFHSIILDPPTFSRSHTGTPFQAENDYGKLVTLALDVAAPNALILLSTNCTTLSPSHLQQIARASLKLAKKAGRFFHIPPPEDIPPSQAASTVWLELS